MMHIIHGQFCQILIGAFAAYVGEGYDRDSANARKHLFARIPLHVVFHPYTFT